MSKNTSVILTSSHGQWHQVQRLIADLVDFCDSSNHTVKLIISESLYSIRHHESSHYVCTSEYLQVYELLVDVNDYWTSAFSKALNVCGGLIQDGSSHPISRIILMNSDMTPSSWRFLIEPRCDLESIVLIDDDHRILRSGYNICGILFRHIYPMTGLSIDKANDFYCDIVPTRLISISSFYYSHCRALHWIRKYLPHYAADYVFTSYLSWSTSSRWLVRTDYFISEDTTSTGIKSISRFSFPELLIALRSVKSYFNLRSIFFYPWIVRHNTLSMARRLFYVLLFWSSYFVRLAKAFGGEE
jgi:hypothetical protein